MTDLEKMLAGIPYQPLDDNLYNLYMECHKKIFRYNNLEPDDFSGQDGLIREILGKCGDKVRIEAPFHCDYGFNIEVGDYFFANYNLVILDIGKVAFGDYVFLGPNVAIYAVSHPIHHEKRKTGFENGAPVTMGDNVWVGGNAVITPGVAIGDNVVIGAGSVVTRDLPDNVVAVGNPARVLRQITDEDRQYYYKKHKFSDCGIDI